MSKKEQENHTESWLCGSSELFSLQLFLRLNNLKLGWLLTKEVCMNFATTWKEKFCQLEPSSFIDTTLGWTEAIPSYFIHACVY